MHVKITWATSLPAGELETQTLETDDWCSREIGARIVEMLARCGNIVGIGDTIRITPADDPD